MIGQHNPDHLTFLQSREESSESLIEEYASMMADGTEFGPVSALVDPDGNIYVWDGFHRGEAARRAGLPLAVETVPGDREQAEWLAYSANTKHGLRRSQADKRRAVRGALLHPNGFNMSNSAIARHCGVSDKTVASIRAELETTSEIPKSDVRIGADGREINTAKIGSNQPEWVSVWRLQHGVMEWLALNNMPIDRQIDVLEDIKNRTNFGGELLDSLVDDDDLPGPRRKRDVVQACNNVLDMLLQKRAEQAQRQSLEVRYCPTCGNEQNIPRQELAEPGLIKCLWCSEDAAAQDWLGEPPPEGLAGETPQSGDPTQEAGSWLLPKGWTSPSPPLEQANSVVLCPHCDEAIFPEQDARADGSIVCDACKHRFRNHEEIQATTLKPIEEGVRQAEALAEQAGPAQIRRAVARFEPAKSEMPAPWTCGRCKSHYPPGPRYNIPDLPQEVCGACLVELSHLVEPKPAEPGGDAAVGEPGKRREQLLERLIRLIDGVPDGRLDTVEVWLGRLEESLLVTEVEDG